MLDHAAASLVAAPTLSKQKGGNRAGVAKLNTLRRRAELSLSSCIFALFFAEYAASGATRDFRGTLSLLVEKTRTQRRDGEGWKRRRRAGYKNYLQTNEE